MCNICEVVPQRYVTSYRCACHKIITTKDTKTCYGTCHLCNRIDSFSYDHTPLHYKKKQIRNGGTTERRKRGKSPQILKDETAENHP